MNKQKKEIRSYSITIIPKEKPKLEPQSIHFSGQSHSLHCSVIQESTNSKDNVYVYHFSDAMSHNWAFTKCVVLDNIKTHLPDANVVRIKIVNCSQQYKCCSVFGMYQQLAVELKKYIILYYGASGHGHLTMSFRCQFIMGCEGPS